MNEDSFILTLTSLLELVSLIERKKDYKCINAHFSTRTGSQFESDFTQLNLFNKTHVITYYDKNENRTTFVSFETIFQCITPIFSNYTNMWSSFKSNFDKSFAIKNENSMIDHFFQPEVQSIIYVSSILILFTLIFGLTLLCRKDDKNASEILENNPFLSNTLESLDCTKEKDAPINFENRKWYNRTFSKRRNQSGEINEMSFVSAAHLVNMK